jgi:hypothetical protein
VVSVSEVALFKADRRSGDWLQWIVDAMLNEAVAELPSTSPLRLVLADATCASKPGSDRTDFRLHACVRLPERRFVQAELTDGKGGESLKRFAVKPGDVWVSDMGYGNCNNVAHVHQAGGFFLGRINTSSMPLWTTTNQRIDPLVLARSVAPGTTFEQPVSVKLEDGTTLAGRLCVYALTPEQAEKAQRRRSRKKGAKAKRPKARAIESAKYVFIFSTLPASVATTRQVFAIYRLRWQIELAFKTLKTVLKLGQLPNKVDETARTWLLAKLVCALLLERLAARRQAFPPDQAAA